MGKGGVLMLCVAFADGVWVFRVKSRIALAKDVGWVAEEITSGLLPFSYPSMYVALSISSKRH